MFQSIETYGAKLVDCRDIHGSSCRLSPSPRGVLVFQQLALIQTWEWNLIRKISFKQRKFLIKLRREDGTPGDTKTFTFKSRDAAKTFWKCSIENHSFFHLQTTQPPKKKPLVVSKGSNFRYSGKTQEELKVVTQRNPRPNQDYSRKTSIRKPKTQKKENNEVDGEYNKLHAPHEDISPQPPSYGSATRNDNKDTIDNIVSEAEEQVLLEIKCIPRVLRILFQHKMISPNPTQDLKPDAIEEEPLYDEPRKLRWDFNYSICKEICMTERL